MKNIFNDRRFKYGSFATLLGIGFVVAIIIINVISSVLVDRFPLSVDLTKDKIFELSDDTKNYLKALDQDVEIIVLANKEDFMNSGDYLAQAITVLDNYQKYSDKVKVSYVDIVKNPSIVAQYPDLQLTTSNILVKSAVRNKKITISDLFNIESDQYGGQTIASSKAEQTVTSAIVGVTDEEAVVVSLLTGHEETVSPGLAAILSSNNYETVSQKILTEDLNPDAKFIVINAPMRDYTPDEIKKLDTYLDNGGKLGKTLLYFASSDQPVLPNIEEFLTEWGIKIGTGIVYETDNNYLASTNPFATFTEFLQEDYTENLKGRDLMVMLPQGKPLSALFDAKGNLELQTLLGYTDASRLYPADAAEDYQPNDNDVKGPFSAVIRTNKIIYEGNVPMTTSVIACSTLLGVDESITSSSVVGNGQYFASMLNTISAKKNTISIVPKTIGAAQLKMTGAQIIILGLLFVILLPLAVLIMGIVIWVKRRNR